MSLALSALSGPFMDFWITCLVPEDLIIMIITFLTRWLLLPKDHSVEDVLMTFVAKVADLVV